MQANARVDYAAARAARIPHSHGSEEVRRTLAQVQVQKLGALSRRCSAAEARRTLAQVQVRKLGALSRRRTLRAGAGAEGRRTRAQAHARGAGAGAGAEAPADKSAGAAPASGPEGVLFQRRADARERSAARRTRVQVKVPKVGAFSCRCKRGSLVHSRAGAAYRTLA